MLPRPSLLARRMAAVLAAPALVAILAAGCIPSILDDAKKKRVEEEAQAKARAEQGSIIRKTTQEIGKYDPAAGRVLSDSKVRASSPMFYAMEAYGPIMEQVSKLNIDHMLLMYNVEHDRWPTYEEFLRDIIKGQNVHLPVLPAKMEYQYDEANHRLVTVYPEGTEVEPADATP